MTTIAERGPGRGRRSATTEADLAAGEFQAPTYITPSFTAVLPSSDAAAPASLLNDSGGAARRQQAGAAQNEAIPIVLGTDRLGGRVIEVLPFGTGELLISVLWSVRCAAVDQLRVADQPIPDSWQVQTYTGSQSAADAWLVSAHAARGEAFADTYAGVAYSVLRLPDGELASLAFTARVVGVRMYDPRKDSTAGGSGAHRLADPATWEASSNPRLQVAHLITNTEYGAGRLMDWQSVRTSADACDALVDGAARLTCDLALIDARDVADWISVVSEHGLCWVVGDGQTYRLIPDDPRPVATAVYAHADDQIAAVSAPEWPDPLRLKNSIEVAYTDRREIPYREEVALPYESAALTAGADVLRAEKLRMPGYSRAFQAARYAQRRYWRQVAQRLSVTLFDVGQLHEPGDRIDLTHPALGGTLACLVTAPPEPDSTPGQWRLPLIEYLADAYSTVVPTEPNPPPAPPPGDAATTVQAMGIRAFSITMTSGQTTGTATIASVNVARAAVAYAASFGVDVAGGGFTVKLESDGVTVTAQRIFSAGASTITGYVVEFQSGVACKPFSMTIPANGNTATAGISSTNTAKAWVLAAFSRCSSDRPARVELTDATTVTAFGGAAAVTIIEGTVIETP